jgi:RNA polymerase sigma-70 factor (ECF subfamily)
MTTEEFKIELLPVKNKLFRLSISLLGNRQEAEDTVQEAYLKIWNMRHDLKKYRSREALLVTITRNLCLDKLKSKKNSFASLNEQINHNSPHNPQQLIEQSDAVSQVKTLIQKLPEQQKTIIHLRDIEGYNYDEILEITGFSLNYVRVNLSRARNKIREKIQKIQNHETRRV